LASAARQQNDAGRGPGSMTAKLPKQAISNSLFPVHAGEHFPLFRSRRRKRSIMSIGGV
jgi:hypothetical protein